MSTAEHAIPAVFRTCEDPRFSSFETNAEEGFLITLAQITL
jgi:hypothetical protein